MGLKWQSFLAVNSMLEERELFYIFKQGTPKGKNPRETRTTPKKTKGAILIVYSFIFFLI